MEGGGGVFYEDLKKWPRFNGTALYIVRAIVMFGWYLILPIFLRITSMAQGKYFIHNPETSINRLGTR